MTDAQQPELAVCSQCGAQNAVDNRVCWLCQQPLVMVAQSVAPPPAPAQARPQFGLSTLLVGLTIVALCLGMFRYAPGMTIFLLIVSVPALFRAYAANQKDASQGRAVTPASRLANFLVSAALLFGIACAGVVVFAVSAAVALFAVCIGMLGNRAPVVPLLPYALVIGGVVLVIGLTVATWPGKRKPR